MRGVGQKDTQLENEANPLPLPDGKRTTLLTLEQFRERLGRFAEDTGYKAELARRLNVTGQFIGEVIAGRKNPGPKLLSALGAKRRVMIEVETEAE